MFIKKYLFIYLYIYIFIYLFKIINKRFVDMELDILQDQRIIMKKLNI